MKILHIIPSMSLLDGGPPQVVADLCKAQTELGADITLVTTDADGTGHLDVPLEQAIEKDGYCIIYFRRTLQAYTFSLPLTRWLIAHISDYDFVHAHAVFCYPPLLAGFLASLHHIPFTIMPHGLLLTWGLKHGRTWAKKLSMAFVDIPILNKAVFVHATSEAEHRELETLKLRSPVETVLLGWNPTKDTSVEADNKPIRWPEVKQDTIKILYLGRFHYKKGLDLLFSAFSQALEQQNNLQLLLAGKGDSEYEVWMHREIEQLGIQNNVRWLGFIDGSDKAYTYLKSDIVVVPSYSESFGLVVLEAMAYGIAVIVSDQVAIHSEVEQAGAGIVIPCQVAPLAEAISLLAQEPELRQTMGQHGKRAVRESCSMEKTASSLLLLYRNYARYARK